MGSSQIEFVLWVELDWISENRKYKKKQDINYCVDIANDNLYWLLMQ